MTKVYTTRLERIIRENNILEGIKPCRANREFNRKPNLYFEYDNRRSERKKQRALDNATRYKKSI